MSEASKKYIEAQFSRLSFVDGGGVEWHGTIQVRGVDSSTNHFNITKEQAEKIKQILLDG